MAQNSLYPGFLKIYYQSSAFNHTATIGVNPIYDSIADNWKLTRKNGTESTVAVCLADYMLVARPLVPSTTIFQYAELWVYPSEESDPEFKVLIDLELAGTGTGTDVTRQQIYSYRSGNGGNGKIAFMSAVAALNVVAKPPNYTSTNIKNMADFIQAPESFIYARDNSYPIAVPRAITKTNDALRKKLLLDV